MFSRAMGLLITLGVAAMAMGQITTPTGQGQISTRISPGEEDRIFRLEDSGRGVRYVDPRAGDEYFPVNINNWWGHMNQRGELIVWPQFDWTDYLYDGLARVVVKGYTGFIGSNRAMAIEPALPWADRFSDGYAIVGNGQGKFGFINKAGNLIVPVELDGALRFREGMAAIRVGGACGFVNVAGKVVVSPQYLRARSFHNGMAMVQHPGRVPGTPGALGYINKAGNMRFEDREGTFRDLGDFCDGLARAQVGARWGYIDQTFKLRIPAQFEEVRDFTNGLAAVRLDGRWGFIDKSGSVVVIPQFDWAADFSDTYAMIRLNGRYGYVNRIASAGISPQFTWAEPFVLKLARVAQEPNFGYIDAGGRPVWDPRRPLELVRNESLRGRMLAAPNPHRPERPAGVRLLELPPLREPVPVPYPADFLYEPQLPGK